MIRRYFLTLIMAALTTFILSLTACLALTPPAEAHSMQSVPKTSLWKVTSPQRVLYIASDTLHLTRKTYPLPVVFNRTFAQSGSVYFEQDPSIKKQKATVKKIKAMAMKLGRLPKGETLSRLLDKQQLSAVKTTASWAGVPLAKLENLQPWFAALVLRKKVGKKLGTQRSLQLTWHFYNKAVARKMPTMAFEKISTTIHIFSNLPTQKQLPFLMKITRLPVMLATSAKPQSLHQKILGAIDKLWRNGNMAPLAAGLKKWRKHHPDMYQALVSNRSRHWVKTLAEQLKHHGKPVFIVVGAGHLAGPDNMLELLRKDGYTVRQL